MYRKKAHQTLIHRYFKTRKQADLERITASKKKREEEKAEKEKEEIKREEEEALLKEKLATEKREADILNSVYRTLRYWITVDGNLYDYAIAYSNPYIRPGRILYLEPTTIHEPHVQTFIDEVLSTKKG